MLSNRNDQRNHPCNKLNQYSEIARSLINTIYSRSEGGENIPCDSLPRENKYFRSIVSVNRSDDSHPNSQLFPLNSVLAMIVKK